MIATFYTNIYYFKHTDFINEFYYILYALTFLMKPVFYITLYFGLLINSNIKSLSGAFIMLMIIISIYFGLPIKEYIDFFNFKTAREYFEGKEYIVSEYCLTHFIVNTVIENIPITFLVVINNLMLGKKGHTLIYDPIITNALFVVVNILVLCLLNYHKIKF
jgi:hypothetical protein